MSLSGSEAILSSIRFFARASFQDRVVIARHPACYRFICWLNPCLPNDSAPKFTVTPLVELRIHIAKCTRSKHWGMGIAVQGRLSEAATIHNVLVADAGMDERRLAV